MISAISLQLNTLLDNLNAKTNAFFSRMRLVILNIVTNIRAYIVVVYNRIDFKRENNLVFIELKILYINLIIHHLRV